MQTIVELPSYLKKSEKLLSKTRQEQLINYLAANPRAGVLMQGTGGIRKIRWSIEGKGKSGGVRVVYFYHDSNMPIFLLSIFGKNEKSNLTKNERNELSKLTAKLKQIYGDQNEKSI